MSQPDPTQHDARPPSGPDTQFQPQNLISNSNAHAHAPTNAPLRPSFPSAPGNPSPAPAPPRRRPYLLNGGKQITRSRVSYSCHTCRRRKVKCDKVHPVCGNCVKTGSECVYDVRSLQQRRPSEEREQSRLKRRRDAQRLAHAPLTELLDVKGGLRELQEQGVDARVGGSGEIAARLDRLTSMIERLSQAQPGQGEEGDAVSVGDTRSSSPKRNGDAGSDDFPIPAGLETDLVDPVGSLNLGHLSLDESGKSRYVGTTYFAYISDEIQELNQLLREQNRSQDQPNARNDSPEADSGTYEPPQTWSSLNKPMEGVIFAEESPASNTAISPGALDHVPTRRQSNILFKGFISGVHAISPVVHPPSVLKLYEAFWEWYENRAYTGEPCPNASFIPLLYAIWYGGSNTISLKTIHAEFDVESRSMLSGPYHDEVTRWLKKISFPRNASLHGLAAFLLVQTILIKEEEPLMSSLFISLALRVAQTMGLHRDPAQFGIPPYEAETRRRVWWHIVHMDGVVAMSSGLPPQVSDENYWDVRVTSELKDTLIGTQEGDVYEKMVQEGVRKPDRPDDPSVCGSSIVNVHYISAKGKYVMAQAVRKILKIQLGTKPVTRKDMEDLRTILIDLQAKLHALVDRIPIPKSQDLYSGGATTYSSASSLKPDLNNGGPGCMEQYHTPTLAAFHKWARILLCLFVHKAFCVAYQPFLKNAKSKIWPAARQCALRHCHGFMEKFILLATDPDFQPFQWSWPGNHQPMHATMIMLIDLYIHPTSYEAPKSRAFIDKVFSLSGPDGGVVGGEDGISTSRPLKDGGREAWDMMRRLREKAWLKAGLDPGVLWTEQAQAQVCSSRKSSGGDDGAGANITSFADGYYAMLKEGYDAQAENEASRRTHQAPLSTRAGWVNIDTTMTDPVSMPNRAHNAPSTDSKTPLWPSQLHDLPNFSNLPSLSPFPYSSPPGQQEIPDLLGQANHSPATTSPQTTITTTHTNTTTNLFPQPQPSSSTLTNPDFPPLHIPSADSTSLNLNLSANANANVNFDWDKWDAVFGEYLPVVDGFMDLDAPAPAAGSEPGHGHQRQASQQVRPSQAQAQHRRSQSQMVTRGVMASGSGFMDETFGFDGVGFKNWADFG